MSNKWHGVIPGSLKYYFDHKNRYVTKKKLFRIHKSGSDSESLVLTESKNIYFTKIGGTKK